MRLHSHHLTKDISHEEDSSLVQFLKKPDVICWEPMIHDMEDHSVVHGVESIFNIKEEHDRETFSPAKRHCSLHSWLCVLQFYGRLL